MVWEPALFVVHLNDLLAAVATLSDYTGMQAATAEHAAYAFLALESAFAGVADAAADAAAAPPRFAASPAAPFFVSISNGATLRGCLGSLTPRPLTELRDWARRAAFRDSRFAPLERAELASATLTVSLLHGHELASGPEAWDVGVHGITVDFDADAGAASFRATFLPYVAAEQKWSKTETLRRLVRKAGFAGALELVLASMRVTRFLASTATLSYAEFLALR